MDALVNVANTSRQQFRAADTNVVVALSSSSSSSSAAALTVSSPGRHRLSPLRRPLSPVSDLDDTKRALMVGAEKDGRGGGGGGGFSNCSGGTNAYVRSPRPNRLSTAAATTVDADLTTLHSTIDPSTFHTSSVAAVDASSSSANE